MALEDEELMDESQPEIVVGSTSKKRKLRPYPISPGAAGLLATAVAAPSGPLAPVIGLGTWLYARHKQNAYNDAQAEYLQNIEAERQGLQDILRSEYEGGDEDEKRMLRVAQGMVSDGFIRLASGDPSGEKLVADGRALLTGVVQGDIQARKAEEAAQSATQRELVSTAAKQYRADFQTTFDNAQQADTLAAKILDLVADPEFDPNKPVNKAALGDLLSLGAIMFKDSPDIYDALSEGSGALGNAAQAVIGGVTTYLKSDDFKVTPQDYNKLALNMRKYAKLHAERKLGELGQRSQALDSWAKKLGIIPVDSSVGEYVSGGVKELKFTPSPAKMRTEHVNPKENDRRRELLRGSNNPAPMGFTTPLSKSWTTNKRGLIRRPTN